jgi:hypothetical protein
MYIHPNSIGHNVVEMFPEIFTDNKVDFSHFCVALDIYKSGRAGDYFAAGSFLFASKATKDINMLFSSVQRCYGGEYVDFQAHISSKRVRSKLLGITDTKLMSKALKAISDDYNAKYGMNRQIHSFYVKYLKDTSKKSLNSSIAVPAHYYASFAEDKDAQVKQRIDFLLKFRNSYDHFAQYHQLSPTGEQYEHVAVVKGNKEYTFLVKLTFDELYEITRQAMSSYWLEEYETSIADGRKAFVDSTVKKFMDENKRLNAEFRKAKK